MHLSGQWTDKVRASAGNVSAEGEAYREAFEEAQEMACDAFEYEARRRAIEGVKRFKFHNGKPIIDPETGQPYFEYEYSDTLLIFLLKGAMPEKYRERFERSAAPDYHSSAGLGAPVGPDSTPRGAYSLQQFLPRESTHAIEPGQFERRLEECGE